MGVIEFVLFGGSFLLFGLSDIIPEKYLIMVGLSRLIAALCSLYLAGLFVSVAVL